MSRRTRSNAWTIAASAVLSVALAATTAAQSPGSPTPGSSHGATPHESTRPGETPHGPMPPGAAGQGPMDHGAMHHGAMHHAHHGPMGHGAAAGQDAFAAVAEVLRILDADPRTDWSRVDLERLRQHLIDMNEVVLRAAVTQTPVPGGLAMEVTGTGRTADAIRAMVPAHARELDRMPGLSARAEPIQDGQRLTVTAKPPGDARAVARLRALGFIGLLTEGAHHGPHHLAIARGEAPDGHDH